MLSLKEMTLIDITESVNISSAYLILVFNPIITSKGFEIISNSANLKWFLVHKN
jgi:hypothetical protein